MANGAYIPVEYKNNFKPDGSYDYQGAMNNYINEMNSQASSLEGAYNKVNATLQQQADFNKQNVANEYYGNRQASAFNYKVGQKGLKELMANKGLANSGDNISANINLHNQYSGEQNKLNYEETNALSSIDLELSKAIADNDLKKANELNALKQQLLDKQMSMDTWWTEYQNTLKQQEEEKRRWDLEWSNKLEQQQWERNFSERELSSRYYSSGGSGSSGSSGDSYDEASGIYDIAMNPNENFDSRINSLQNKKAELNAYGDTSKNNYIDELIKQIQLDKNIYSANRPQSNNIDTPSKDGYAPYTDGWFKANGYVKSGNGWKKPSSSSTSSRVSSKNGSNSNKTTSRTNNSWR